jgi:formyltetrahydrofolate-dependent phosphoribosylglycinamide formyltransferase
MEDADATQRRIAVLASGSGTNLQAIMDACAAGRICASVVHVVSDRDDAFALQRAAGAGTPATALPRRAGEQRADYDTRLADVVAAADPDLVVLAGWMRILTMNFLGRFPGRVVNLHPALPGELPGTDAIVRAWDQAQRGERNGTGVMVHLVPDEGVDDGPVLGTAPVPIEPGDTPEALAARVHAAEHRLLVDVLADLCAKEHRSLRSPATQAVASRSFAGAHSLASSKEAP